ncbi:cytochrome b/b6 domain-containing protein (plasmid) [Streptomyces sp. NBC_00841]|uniref:cytochrome b/b6 domain-containing protein n=1 Tax=unclassified Streptomyces TaxID=2593676 RepID=UPI00224CF141|nr:MULTISPECIES: cytochrome b/b6 domain-containing protein [unclassified Streptomyces]MCX4538799.1 cytochrome b/b6 domain-containing protein [Streptomyces sp. NBC_01669]WSA05399.1 cytochrome b/b6 domain-containing protein [Streptomyces sp. NBC_00841]
MRSTAGSTTPTGTAKQPDPTGRVRRFGTAERMVHRFTGYLMLVCLVSAACLYLGPLAQLVGRRHVMVTVHEWSGISLPLPFLLGLLSADFRADLRRLNRFAVYDRQWLRAARRRLTSPEARPAGEFNAGQKLYAGWIVGAVLVMMFTGLLMWFMGLLPFISRTSAIFIHDLLAWAITFVVLGHMRKAFEDPEARLGMRTGYVSRSWAQRYHSRWLREERDGDVADRADEV